MLSKGVLHSILMNDDIVSVVQELPFLLVRWFGGQEKSILENAIVSNYIVQRILYEVAQMCRT